MMSFCRQCLAIGFFAATSTISAEPIRWEIDESHSTVQFAITFNVMMEAVGDFGAFSGEIVFDPSAESGAACGSVNAEIEVTSLTTGNQRRDDHLQAEDFFNTALHPLATFASRTWEASEEPGQSVIVGDLTIMERTAPVTLKVLWNGIEKDRRGREVGHWVVTGTLDRRDWGIDSGTTIGNEVRLKFEIEAIAQEAEPTTDAPTAPEAMPSPST
jgi:polyisoprenoid-binding protein YceI